MGSQLKGSDKSRLCVEYVDKNRQGLFRLGLLRVTTTFFRAGTLLWGNMFWKCSVSNKRTFNTWKQKLRVA